MGTNHGRVSRKIRDVEITCVIDPLADRARTLAETFGAKHSSHLPDVLGLADAAVVAVPTNLHRPVSEFLLGQGLHVLVEKPLAHRVEDARALVKCAKDAGRLLQVGHVERFNPAVMKLGHVVRDLIHIDIQRIGPFSERVADGVILDLMIHDLDIARWLAQGAVRHVSAIAQHVTAARDEDLASALVTFENGITACLTASRVGQNKIRSLSLTQAQDFVSVDLLRQSVTIHRVDHAEYLGETGMSFSQTGVIEVPFIEGSGEPLLLELEAFVKACLDGTQPLVSGEDGLRALELAERVRAESMRTATAPGPAQPAPENTEPYTEMPTLPF